MKCVGVGGEADVLCVMLGMKFWGNACAQYNAAQAFAFIAAVLWFVSFVLGLLVWAKRDRSGGVAADGAAAPTTTG